MLEYHLFGIWFSWNRAQWKWKSLTLHRKHRVEFRPTFFLSILGIHVPTWCPEKVCPFLIGPQWLIVVNTFSYPYALKRMKNTMSFIFSPIFCNVSFAEKCHRYLPSVGWLHLHSSRMMTTTCWVLIFAIAQREERYKSKLWELARCSTTLENGKHPLAQNCNVLQLATTKSNATFLCKITMIVHSHWPSKLCSSSTKGQTTTPKIIIE